MLLISGGNSKYLWERVPKVMSLGGLAGLGGDVGVDQEPYDREDIRGGPLVDETLIGTDTDDEA